MEINAIYGNNEQIYRLIKIEEIQEWHKRENLTTKYNRGVNIIRVIDTCVGVTTNGLGMTEVGFLSAIVAAPAEIGMEAVSIVMGLLRVVGNWATKMLSLKIEKHEKIAMLAISSLNTISGVISKALSDDSISDEEYSLILLEIETFTRIKEDIREKYKVCLENTW